jgi:predicted permease
MAVAPFWANLTYLGFPLAISAYGDAGLRVAAIVNAFTMPLFIVLGSVLLVWRSASAGERTADVNSDADADADADAAASTAAPSVLQALRIGVVNPVSLAALGGVAVVAIGEQLGWQHWFAIEAVARPLAVAEQVVGMIAAMGLPLALLCVGAELDFGRLQGQRHQLLAMSAAKLVLAPTLTWVLLAAWAAIWPGTVDSTALSVAVMMMALPSAVGAFVMATNLRAGTKVLAGHLVASTVVACLTVPLWLWILLLVYPTTGS